MVSLRMAGSGSDQLIPRDSAAFMAWSKLELITYDSMAECILGLLVTITLVSPAKWLQTPYTISANHQTECQARDQDLSESSYDEWAQALFRHFAEVGAQSDTGEGEEECPLGKIPERRDLPFAECVETDQQ